MTGRVLSLFVSGRSASSERARENLAKLQENGIPAEWRIEVIDVLADPGRAEGARILATPTLALQDEDRSRRVVGDLGDIGKVLEFLGVRLKGSDE